MVDVLVRPVADAFLQVGVFVAAMLALFGYLQYRTGDRLTEFLASRWRSAPLVGALLGVTPGCGGAILVMPLYVRGTVSFGTVVAALVATMGDASFVIIAAQPRVALVIHAILLVVGVVAGYATDLLGIAPRPALQGRSLGAAEALPPPSPRGPAVTALGTVPAAFWWLAAAGMLIAVPTVVVGLDPAALAARLGGVEPGLVVGVLGTLLAVVVLWRDGRSSETGTRHASVRAMLLDAARETSFVTVCVAGAYVATAVVTTGFGVDLGAAVTAAGFLGVLIGAAIGLIPGCAVQVLLTGLYTTGIVPFATLLSNALSQDGDALFPLLFMDRRTALVATAVTTLPAVLVGGGALLLL